MYVATKLYRCGHYRTRLRVTEPWQTVLQCSFSCSRCRQKNRAKSGKCDLCGKRTRHRDPVMNTFRCPDCVPF